MPIKSHSSNQDTNIISIEQQNSLTAPVPGSNLQCHSAVRVKIDGAENPNLTTAKAFNNMVIITLTQCLLIVRNTAHCSPLLEEEHLNVNSYMEAGVSTQEVALCLSHRKEKRALSESP